MLIYDPVGENDWFAFEVENRKLQLEHPKFITLKVYEKTGDFSKDLSIFVKGIIKYNSR
jgi:hypothetical protein